MAIWKVVVSAIVAALVVGLMVSYFINDAIEQNNKAYAATHQNNCLPTRLIVVDTFGRQLTVLDCSKR